MTKAAKPASASMAMRKAQKAALVRRYAGEATSKSAAKGGSKNSPAPLVGVIMGSVSDWPTMQKAADLLSQFAVPFESRIVSAHRTPERLFSYARDAQKRGLKVIIAGAGGAAHLPGMTAAMTTLPVIGVPVQSKALSGLDSLLSIVQMPPGIPVATVAIGEAGAANAALLAMSILALSDEELGRRLAQWRMAQTEGVPETPQAD